MRLAAFLPVALGACLHPAVVPGGRPVMPFAFEARPTEGEIRVVPALRLHEPLDVELDSFLGPALPPGPVSVRVARTRELQELSRAVGLALPCEVNGALGAAWPGQFTSHDMPQAAQRHLEEALRGEGDLDQALADAARAVGGDGVLFSWMDRLEASPLSLVDVPGAVLDTPAGPVVLDDRDEPYLVSARIGMALVAADGEVVLRYTDTYETVLSGARGPTVAGQDLAREIVDEVAMVWAVDPRLLEGEPRRGTCPPPPPARQRRGPVPMALR